jgi:hypothetical protein
MRFNSSKVQLKVTQAEFDAFEVIEFQFLKGSIKSNNFIRHSVADWKFQFLKGSIKSLLNAEFLFDCD